MNTKTMRLPPRRFLTPSKRKEPDGFRNSVKPSITTTTAPPTTTTIPSKLPKPTKAVASFDKQPKLLPEPAKSNQLLAGYLAHEFLSKGTLFGQPFDPAAARAEIVAKKQKVMSAEVQPSGGGGGGGRRVEPMKEDKCERYVDISGLLKREGTHIEGIVNPTQLARFLQL